MGQSNPGSQHQGGVRSIRCRYSIKPVPRKCRLIARRDRYHRLEFASAFGAVWTCVVGLPRRILSWSCLGLGLLMDRFATPSECWEKAALCRTRADAAADERLQVVWISMALIWTKLAAYRDGPRNASTRPWHGRMTSAPRRRLKGDLGTSFQIERANRAIAPMPTTRIARTIGS